MVYIKYQNYQYNGQRCVLNHDMQGEVECQKIIKFPHERHVRASCLKSLNQALALAVDQKY